MEEFEKFCEKYGYTLDNDKTKLKTFFSENGNQLKEVHIDAYLNDNLILRSIEKNTIAKLESSYLYVYKKGKSQNAITIIDSNKIEYCVYKKYSDTFTEFVIVVGDIKYRISVWF